MVATQNERDGAGARHLVDRFLQLAHGARDVAGIHFDVAGVDDPQVAQPVDPQRQDGREPSCGR